MTQDDSDIIQNHEVLEERYVPSRIRLRHQQVEQIQQYISPTFKGRSPHHIWLHGNPGSGKTVVTKSVLNRLEDKHRMKQAFVSCGDYGTHYAILGRIIQEFGILGNNQERSSALKIEVISKSIGARPSLVVLDEVGRLRAKERERVLWTICSLERTGLICITTSLQPLYSLDSRLLERLSPSVVGFASYSPQEMHDLLKERAQLALRENSWDTQTIQAVARLAGPNARLAIHTLRRAAEIAESVSCHVIKSKHVLEAFGTIRILRTNAVLQRLSKHHRAIHEIVRNQPAITSGKLREAYLVMCETHRIKPVGERTFQLYVDTLINKGLLRVRRAALHGNTRQFWVRE